MVLEQRSLPQGTSRKMQPNRFAGLGVNDGEPELPPSVEQSCSSSSAPRRSLAWRQALLLVDYRRRCVANVGPAHAGRERGWPIVATKSSSAMASAGNRLCGASLPGERLTRMNATSGSVGVAIRGWTRLRIRNSRCDRTPRGSRRSQTEDLR